MFDLYLKKKNCARSRYIFSCGNFKISESIQLELSLKKYRNPFNSHSVTARESILNRS